jgi:glycosyltransferase involved in cell wall biosynthesis
MVNDARDLKVLWLSPWMRPLARIYAESLMDAGAEVLLVTADQHPGSDAARSYELVLDPRPKTARTWPEAAHAALTTRRFSPNVVVAELVRDPRWMTFAPGVPRIELIHDDRPHDVGEMLPRWERTVFGWWRRRSKSTVAFSRYVAEAVGASAVVPLTSDLDEVKVPQFAAADNRRDFVLLGRLNDYKNIDVCLRAWQKHTASSTWRGDRLMLIGAGEWRRPLPDHVVWQSSQFRYDDVLPILACAKASVVHYRRASQSGVQLLSMQLGVTPIVSTQGGLPEFQPRSEAPIGVEDADALAAAFDSLADPYDAAARGALSREHYIRWYSAAASTDTLIRTLREVARPTGYVRGTQPR